MHKETLQAELKMVKEDIHRVTLELTERQQRVDKLHSKHDVLTSRNATPDGEVHSQVRLLPYRRHSPKFCQKKEMSTPFNVMMGASTCTRGSPVPHNS